VFNADPRAAIVVDSEFAVPERSCISALYAVSVDLQVLNEMGLGGRDTSLATAAATLEATPLIAALKTHPVGQFAARARLSSVFAAVTSLRSALTLAFEDPVVKRTSSFPLITMELLTVIMRGTE
jgi:hypothetical protein